ncbi:MAG TPA: Zn-dependent hydrolase [Thermoanaerobaculia bacterium]|nr:Zn-dependent hydrolase [Thermoanaerobaculia bacterium]
MPLDPSRTVAELRQLARLTSDDGGAQRVCWTPTWQRARDFLTELLEALPVTIENDEAGNRWATLEGRSPRRLLLGGHLDSVPNGGWLDGTLNVLAGLEVLRRIAEEGVPAHSVSLVDWADEEGARFGVSLFGSSAASGSLDLDVARALADRDGHALPEVVAEHGVDLERLMDARRRLDGAAAYLELHIEQGPVLESLGLPLGVVTGTFAAERHEVRFGGQAAHAGSTPMHLRRDALAGAARLALSVRDAAREEGGVGTVGWIEARPGVANIVPGASSLTLDQRHASAAALGRMLRRAEEDSRRVAEDEGLMVEWRRLWRIDPIAFDPALVDLAEASVREVAGASHQMASGPLHDAAEIARAGVPSVMLFVQSLRGLSHTPDEDTRTEHLELSVRALDRLAQRTLEWIGGTSRRADAY